MSVNSFRFVGGVTKQMVRAWIRNEPRREIPWTPLIKPLIECRVALLSSGGIALRSDSPFDQEGERQNPWWGDPSFRVIPQGTQAAEIQVHHLHINPWYGEQDLNCLLPLDRLDDLVEAGIVGGTASRHYSIMGWLLEPSELLQFTVPDMIRMLREDEVDILVLVPS